MTVLTFTITRLHSLFWAPLLVHTLPSTSVYYHFICHFKIACVHVCHELIGTGKSLKAASMCHFGDHQALCCSWQKINSLIFYRIVLYHFASHHISSYCFVSHFVIMYHVVLQCIILYHFGAYVDCVSSVAFHSFLCKGNKVCLADTTSFTMQKIHLTIQ